MNIWNYKARGKKEDVYENITPQLNQIKEKYQNNFISLNEAITQTLSLIRNINLLPIYYYNEDGIQEAIKKIFTIENSKKKDNLFCNKDYSGLDLLRFLFPNFFDASTYCHKSVREIFYSDFSLSESISIMLFKKSKYTIQQLIKNLEFYNYAPTLYPPIMAKNIYESFCPPNSIIYDYSAGYGGRMLGALSSKNNYTYIAAEPNTETYHNLLHLGEEIEKFDNNKKGKYQIYNCGSENINLQKNSIDFIFSSPPYYKVESYSEEETQSIIKYPRYKDWLNNYVNPTLQKCYDALKENGKIGIQICSYTLGKKYYSIAEDWLEIAEKNGFKLVKLFPLKPKRSNKAPEAFNVETLFILEKNNNIKSADADELYSKWDFVRPRVLHNKEIKYCAYDDISGKLKFSYDTLEDIERNFPELKAIIISKHIKSGTPYKNLFFKKIEICEIKEEVPQQIDLNYNICVIDGKNFYSQSEIAKYLKISRQAVSQAKQKKSKIVAGKEVLWV